VPGRGKAPNSHEETDLKAQLDDLPLGEELAELGVQRVVNREMVGRKEICVSQRDALGIAEILSLVWLLKRSDKIFAEAISKGVLVTNGHATAALVVKGDAQSHEFN
jgi:hypothetical protein